MQCENLLTKNKNKIAYHIQNLKETLKHMKLHY
jgi:hypothetical protein